MKISQPSNKEAAHRGKIFNCFKEEANMPIKLYATTVVKAAIKDENDLADEELAKMSEGQEVEQFDLEADSEEDDTTEEDEISFLDEEDLGEEEEGEEEEEKESKLADTFDLLTAFFRINPTPNDQQFHALAQSIGVEPEALEAQVYEVMSIMLEDDDSREAVDQAVDEAEDESEDQELEQADVEPYDPAEAEEDGAPDLDTLPVNASKRLRYSLSRR